MGPDTRSMRPCYRLFPKSTLPFEANKEEMVDGASISRRARRVSSIFNVLATVVLVIGVIAAVGVLVAAIAEGGDAAGIGLGVLYTIGIGIYVILIWAGIQLSSVVAGYIHVRTQDQDSPEEV